MIGRSLAGIGAVALALSATVALGADDASSKADEATLREAGLQPDGPGLLGYLRRQTLADADNARLAQAVRRLGDRSYPLREQATRELLKAERSALPFLKPAVGDSDLEIRIRARRISDAIETGPALSKLEATARLLAERRPEG